MNRLETPGSQGIFTWAAVLLAALYMIAGVSVGLGFGNPGDYPRIAWAIGGLLAGAIILLGIWANRRSPWLGGILVLVGSLPLAVIFYWATVPLVLVFIMLVTWVRVHWIARRAK